MRRLVSHCNEITFDQKPGTEKKTLEIRMKALDTRAHVLGQEKAIDQLLRDYRPEKHVFKSVMTFTTTTYQTASRSQRLQTMESQQVLSYDICCEWFDAYNLQGRAANL